ncbi:hypothetical protein DCAR_0102562 [Daucus carota subsp. sativus]|uniref:Uncharacterized protein n=1 Tax=Daucus carota subsp. sativus TaxID=79200 RepID=A0A169WR93_DAUCS|nr:hypothetical protein DCAR_0102562 [Daucus carota subsp. sativus]
MGLRCASAISDSRGMSVFLHLSDHSRHLVEQTRFSPVHFFIEAAKLPDQPTLSGLTRPAVFLSN